MVFSFFPIIYQEIKVRRHVPVFGTVYLCCLDWSVKQNQPAVRVKLSMIVYKIYFRKIDVSLKLFSFL